MAYTLPDLPYAFDALEPHIDARTMEIHHDKHHAAYVNNVNAALEGTDLADLPIEELLQSLDRVPEDKRNAVRNNGGGHYNHSLFWESLSGSGGGEPSGALGDAIGSAFGSFADFQAKVKAAGVGQFGSGWAWLVHDGSGLAVAGTPNQDNPISQGKTPLLGVDVWEHAYYLLYQNRRPDYIDAWWNVVDWDVVAARFAASRPEHVSAHPPVDGAAASAGPRGGACALARRRRARPLSIRRGVKRRPATGLAPRRRRLAGGGGLERGDALGRHRVGVLVLGEPRARLGGGGLVGTTRLPAA